VLEGAALERVGERLELEQELLRVLRIGGGGKEAG
jgi:hypothetical protein